VLRHGAPLRFELRMPKAVGPCYQTTPVGLPLLRPGWLTIELDAETIEGADPHDLTLLTEHEQQWRPLSDGHVDLEDEVMSATAVYLSAYAVVVRNR